MQVRQVLVAALLAVTAAGAVSQEIDRSETLLGKSLAAQQAQAEARLARSYEAASQPGESEVPTKRAEQTDQGHPVPATKASWIDRHAKHTYAREWLKGDKRQPRPAAIADLG